MTNKASTIGELILGTVIAGTFGAAGFLLAGQLRAEPEVDPVVCDCATVSDVHKAIQVIPTIMNCATADDGYRAGTAIMWPCGRPGAVTPVDGGWWPLEAIAHCAATKADDAAAARASEYAPTLPPPPPESKAPRE